MYMIEIIDKSKCSGCKACYNICPVNCIDMVVDEEGFWYPKVDEDKCIQCGLCEKVCPELNIYEDDKHFVTPHTFAAWNKNDKIRRVSSSGGIFTIIAEWIISNEGVVFGAGYDENFNVVHKEIITENDLEELRGSKYVQSDIGESYRRAKLHLKNNRLVLFTGNPCQIAGLYNYLDKDYPNLYTSDLVCHGVPSPKVFDKYKEYLEDKYGSKIKTISFRDKKHGWKTYSLSTKFSNGKEYSKNLKEDPFLLGFLRNYYLRPSCYACLYSKIPRSADITLGDYWGVESRYPELDNNMGVSLLLVNSEKGIFLLESIKEGLEIYEIDLEHAIKHNPCIIKPVNKPKDRDKFFEDFNNKEFTDVIKKYMSPPSFFEKQIIFAKRGINFARKKAKNILSRDDKS